MVMKLKPVVPFRVPPPAPRAPTANDVHTIANVTGDYVQDAGHKLATSDGSTAGAITTRTGERVFQEEVPWPPAETPAHKPMKFTK